MRCGCGECGACGCYTWLMYVSSAADVLWMSVVRGMRELGGVCEMCLDRGGVGGEVDEKIKFGRYQFCGNKVGVGRVSVFGLRSCA